MYTIVSTDGCPRQNFVVSRRKWSLFVQFSIFYLKMHVNLLVHCMIVPQDMMLITLLFPDKSFSKLSPKSCFFKLLWLSIDPLKKEKLCTRGWQPFWPCGSDKIIRMENSLCNIFLLIYLWCFPQSRAQSLRCCWLLTSAFGRVECFIEKNKCSENRSNCPHNILHSK